MWARTFPPDTCQGWTIHFIERESRYWVSAQAGKKETSLFEQGTQVAWNWVKSAQFIRWFTDGERRYGKALWKLASVYLKRGEAARHYPYRKVWREGLEVAMKIKVGGKAQDMREGSFELSVGHKASLCGLNPPSFSLRHVPVLKGNGALSGFTLSIRLLL